MNSGRSEQSEKKVPSSSAIPLIELRVFECGHGDTLLLCVAGKWWVLIDCHLTARMRDRFFDFVRARDIQRLEMIIQSHPDSDHFRGMLDVLYYFTSEGRSIGRYCDGGVDPRQIRDLIRERSDPEADEYARIHLRLNKLFDANTVEYHPFDENTSPIKFESYRRVVELKPVAPEPRVVRELQRMAVATGRVSTSLNAISLVIGLRAADGQHSSHVLLTGDAEASNDEDRLVGLDRAIDLWKSREAQDGGLALFDVIKVPHHGSMDGLSHSLIAMRRHERSLAVISVGTKYPTHPDRAVLSAYMDAGWDIAATTKRCGEKRLAPSPLDLFPRPIRREDFECRRHSIEICWDVPNGLRWTPSDAGVQKDELRLYETATRR